MYIVKEWLLYYHVLGTKSCPERWAEYQTNIPPTMLLWHCQFSWVEEMSDEWCVNSFLGVIVVPLILKCLNTVYLLLQCPWGCWKIIPSLQSFPSHSSPCCCTHYLLNLAFHRTYFNNWTYHKNSFPKIYNTSGNLKVCVSGVNPYV